MILIAILFILIIGSVFLFEHYLRRYYSEQGKVFAWEPYQKCCLHIDKQALPRLNSICRLDVNSEGELGTEFPKGNCFRFLVVGGSAAECYYLGSDGGWPALLQKELNKPENLISLRTEHAHVGNIARSGVCSKSLLKMLECILPQYRNIDVIICMVGASDLLRWMINGAPSSGESLPIAMEGIFALDQKRIYTWNPKTSAFAEFLRGMKRKLIRKENHKYCVGKSLIRLRNMRANAINIINEVESTDNLVDKFHEQLRNCLILCMQKANRVILVPQPWFSRSVNAGEASFFWNAGKGHPFTEEVSSYYSLELINKCMKLFDEASHKIALDLGIECVNLSLVIPSDFEHLYDEFHVTNLGAEKIADELLKNILCGCK